MFEAMKHCDQNCILEDDLIVVEEFKLGHP